MVDMLGADRTPFSVASFQVIQTEATAGFFLSRVWSYVQEAGVWANIQLSENRPFSLSPVGLQSGDLACVFGDKL